MCRLLIILFLYSIANLGLASDIYPLESAKQEAQFQHLLKQLRCLVCQNQDLSDSNAPLAVDLKKQIYHRVQQGQSDHEIITYLTERYGDFILFKPPVKGATLLLWLGPAGFFFIGLALLLRNCVRRNAHA